MFTLRFQSISFFISLLVIPIFWLIPNSVSAQGFVTCLGPECNFCHAVEMGTSILRWLITLAVIISTIIVSIAGLRMVMARGNPGALNQAKDSLLNIIIGIFIVAIAFTLVDTLMKVLVGGSFGPWNEVASEQCGGSRAAGIATFGIMTEAAKVEALQKLEEMVAGQITKGVPPPVSNAPCGDSEIVSVNAFGKTVQVHKDIAASLQAIDAQWQQLGGNSYYRVTQLGGYRNDNCQGFHSRGLAIDINADTNPACPDSRWMHLCTNYNEMVTNMHQVPAGKPPLYQLFLAAGWDWGGGFSKPKDAMHFSVGEGGRCIQASLNAVAAGSKSQTKFNVPCP